MPYKLRKVMYKISGKEYYLSTFYVSQMVTKKGRNRCGNFPLLCIFYFSKVRTEKGLVRAYNFTKESVESLMTVKLSKDD